MNKKENLYKIIDNFHKYRVLVVGDIILDEYIWGKASRLSPEAPVPVLEVEKYNYIPGGAANVAGNIRALGGQAVLAGVVGVDAQAEQLKRVLEQHNIDSSCLVAAEDRPTTVKTRLLAHNRQQLVRFDREIKNPVSEKIQNIIYEKIRKNIQNTDIILISDYAKGVLTGSFLEKIVTLGNKLHKPILVDPKGLDFEKYSGATLITPNRPEAELATKSPQGTIPEILAEKIRQQLDVKYVLVTLGEDGILFCDENRTKTIPAVTSEVYDVTGAGDSLIAGVSLALTASGGELETAVELGNYAAGVAVRKIGTTAVTPKELKDIIELHSTGKLMIK